MVATRRRRLAADPGQGEAQASSGSGSRKAGGGRRAPPASVAVAAAAAARGEDDSGVESGDELGGGAGAVSGWSGMRGGEVEARRKSVIGSSEAHPLPITQLLT